MGMNEENTVSFRISSVLLKYGGGAGALPSNRLRPKSPSSATLYATDIIMCITVFYERTLIFSEQTLNDESFSVSENFVSC